MIDQMETMLDFGGRRLALTPDGSTCIVGSWGERGTGQRGLAAYSVPYGRLLWNRSDIRRIQSVAASGSGREIYCGVENTHVYIIEASTGTTLSTVRSARKIFGSRYTPHRLVAQKERYTVCGATEFHISPLSFALLDAAFSSDAVCLAEPRNALRPREHPGGVRLLDIETGEQRWYLDLRAIRVAFNSADENFYCIAATESEPRRRSLIRLAGSAADCVRMLVFDHCGEAAFTPSGQALITAKGDVYETSSGVLLTHLDFPQRDYPDPD